MEIKMTVSEKFWNKKAEGYAKSQISDEETYKRKLTETQNILGPEMRLLEFGCGTGTTAIHHAPHVSHIDAIDISENMLDIARERAKDATVENISFARSTLTEFNADANSLDVVLGLNVVHLLPDRQATLAEIARILKPGGAFVNSTVCLGNSSLRFIKPFIPLGKLLGIMPDVYVMTRSEFESEVLSAGLTIERQWHQGAKGAVVFMIARKD